MCWLRVLYWERCVWLRESGRLEIGCHCLVGGDGFISDLISFRGHPLFDLVLVAGTVRMSLSQENRRICLCLL